VTQFSVVPGGAAHRVLSEDIPAVVEIVRDTYLLHERGETVNPDSYFLRFPQRPDSRVIALPAFLGPSSGRFGVKWISSFPGNVADGLPRASAVLLLNDYATGFPIACLESAQISAARTAASAALTARTIVAGDAERRVGFIGCGYIARTIFDHLGGVGLPMSSVDVFDLDPASAELLRAHAGKSVPATTVSSVEEIFERNDVVVLATTAGTPYIHDVALRPEHVVLNVSLRDLAPELLVKANNILDDVDHCMKANTSPHLAEQLTGGRDFVTGTIGMVLRGEIQLDPALPTIVSPFGLGVLDLAVGGHVLARARELGLTREIDDFFEATERW
jgi:N-[(2S)-2-amino-2-carboxyethyl]-L-glutamate dehydrogenase